MDSSDSVSDTWGDYKFLFQMKTPREKRGVFPNVNNTLFKEGVKG